MPPINRIKRWPFPPIPAPVPQSRSGPAAAPSSEPAPGSAPAPVPGPDPASDELRVDGEEMLSLYGALTLALGLPQGKRVFDFIKRLAVQAAEKLGGTPCIYFKDAMGEFIGIDEDSDDDPDDDPDHDRDGGPHGDPDEVSE